MFKEEDAMQMSDALYMIIIPGLLFRQIGLQDLTFRSWYPFLNELLTVIGVFLSTQKFVGCNVSFVCLFLAVHFIITPLVSALWCWICKVDNTTSLICTWSHVSPPGMLVYLTIRELKVSAKSVLFTFFSGNVLAILFLFLWLVVFNELHLFEHSH